MCTQLYTDCQLAGLHGSLCVRWGGWGFQGRSQVRGSAIRCTYRACSWLILRCMQENTMIGTWRLRGYTKLHISIGSDSQKIQSMLTTSRRRIGSCAWSGTQVRTKLLCATTIAASWVHEAMVFVAQTRTRETMKPKCGRPICSNGLPLRMKSSQIQSNECCIAMHNMRQNPWSLRGSGAAHLHKEVLEVMQIIPTTCTSLNFEINTHFW